MSNSTPRPHTQTKANTETDTEKKSLYRHISLITTGHIYAMKVTIKEWNAVATWRWDMPDDDVCGICRVQFDGTCPTCKFPGDDCSLCMLQYRIWSSRTETDMDSIQCSENVAIPFTWWVEDISAYKSPTAN